MLIPVTALPVTVHLVSGHALRLQASGDTREVAIGTGPNLALYPGEARLTGIDLSPAMLGVARHGALQLGRAVDLREADALALPFPDACFDAVVCTFSLCAIPDGRRAVSEMNRVLRPSGLLLLADHIAGAAWPVRAIQRILEVFTVPLQGEHFLRRPLHAVQAEGFTIEQRSRPVSPNGSPPASRPPPSPAGTRPASACLARYRGQPYQHGT